MTNRELSEKLCQLGCKIEEMAKGLCTTEALEQIANELHALSDENYTPHTPWSELKKQVTLPTKQKRYYDKANPSRELPF